MSVRVLGLPVALVALGLMALALTVFFGAWAADAQAQARVRGLSVTVGAEALLPGSTVPAVASGETAPPGQETQGESSWWEKAFLYACPLH